MGRWMSGVAVGVLGAALALQACAQGSVYRWTDKDGKVHFSDVPPPDDAKDVSQKRVSPGPSQDASSSALPYQVQMAMKRSPVTLYIGEKCQPCDDARALLARRGVPYTEHNAQGNAQEIAALRELTGGKPEVPLMRVGDRTVKGYDEEALNGALDSAGYPRSVLPGHLAPEPVRVGGPQPNAAPAAASPSQPQ